MAALGVSPVMPTALSCTFACALLWITRKTPATYVARQWDGTILS